MYDRTPPTIDEIAKRLAARVAMNGVRTKIETTPDHGAACFKCRERRTRSLKYCHLPAEPKPRHPSPRDTGAYVPELAARLDNDRNLSDGARRCARKLAEYIYRKNRDSREAEITVGYLAKGLGRCRRTVQRYLRQLEIEGYIDVRVVPSEQTRMCFGLLIRLLNPLFPRHRRHKWPENAMDRDMTDPSQNYRQRFKRRPIRRAIWVFLCSEGVHRSYMKTFPPPPSLN